ncbi:hypothetical protein N2152v2_008396 [Parachlorella kessleri]
MEAFQNDGLQNMIREASTVLRARGFRYCDDGVDQEPEPLPTELSATPLIAAGLAASSTDLPTQSIARTLDNDPTTFWSSRGTASPEAGAWLLYKLKGPLCIVHFVQLVVFRARYQFGEPIYPPLHVSFQTGPSPASLAPATAVYPVLASSQVQGFLLPASLPAGRFLRVNLHGRQQQQLEDMQWYVAVERVEAFGRQVPPSELASLRSWAQGSTPCLPSPGSLPAHLASCALQAHAQVAVEKQQQPDADPPEASSAHRCGGPLDDRLGQDRHRGLLDLLIEHDDGVGGEDYQDDWSSSSS